MAEQLGEASLRIEVDLDLLRKSLEKAKGLVENELGGTIAKTTRQAGGGTGGGRAARGRAENINEELAANRTLRQLRSNLNKLEAQGVNTVQLRTRYFEIEKQISESLFGSARRNSELLKQQITDEKIKLDVQKQQARVADDAAKASRGTGPSSPIRGGRFIEGSPANLEFLARQGGPSSPIRGSVNLPGSPIALKAAADAERKLARERDATAKATNRAAQQERKANNQRLRDVAANALIGVGFPLLFGQGAGAALGGGIGGGLGALGGGTFGFAGSIAGTALGSAFDVALQKGQELARGLEDPIKNFETLRQAALLSSRAVERNAEALIAAGREEEAAALLRQDLLRTFGTTEGYEEFTRATDELNRSFSQATVALAQFVAGPLAEFLSTIATGLGGGANIRFAQENAARAREIIQADPAQERRFRQLAQQRNLELGPNLEVNSRDLAARNNLVEEFLRLNGEQTAQQQQQIKNEKEMNAAMQSGNTLKALSAKLAVEQARGNELSAAQTERELIAAEKRSKLDRLPSSATQAERRLTAETFTEREAANAERIRSAQDNINRAAFDEQQSRRSINTSISNTIALLGTQSGQYRDTLRTIQSINTSIEESRRKEAELGFQIDQARQAGQEERAAALVDKQKTQALETKQRFIEGAQAIKEAGERIRDNIRDAAQGLQSLRLQNLQFLSPQQRREALAQLERDVAATAEQRGFTPRFRGTRAERIQQQQAFVEFGRREQELTKQISDGNAALVQINTQLISQFGGLSTSMTDLKGTLDTLAAKDWNVDVNVVNQAGGASTVNAVNGLAQ